MTAPGKNDNARRQPGVGVKQNSISAAILDDMASDIKGRLQAGETVAATDYPPSQRPAYWGAIPLVRDELPAVRPVWRTIGEVHIDGRRLREKTFRLRASGATDPVLAAWMVVGILTMALALQGVLV
jgi:hypothetical protein